MRRAPRRGTRGLLDSPHGGALLRRSTSSLIVRLGLCGGGGGGATAVNLATFQAASDIIGQNTSTGGAINNGGGVTPNDTGLNFPLGHVGEGGLYVPEMGNSRLLGFFSVPTGLGPAGNF